MRTSWMFIAPLLGVVTAVHAAEPQQLAERLRHQDTLARRALRVPLEYPTIQQALDAAHDGQTVIVGDGVYTGPGNVDLDFAGKSIRLRSLNGASSTLIDCAGTPTAPHRGFNFHSGETGEALVDGFTIMNGSTLQGAVADPFNGGAILCTQGSSPTIRNCVLRNNWAGCWGAAVCCSFSSHPTIENCHIVDNLADDDGGGIFAWSGSSPRILNSVIAHNEALITGGGIVSFGGDMVVLNSVVVGNHAQFGAGIYGWTLEIGNSIVWNNTGAAQQVEGGPYIYFSTVEGGFVGDGNVDWAPGFVDAAGGDFHLLPDSPLIDAGDPLYKPSASQRDIDGQPRLISGRVDIGADEYMP